MKFGTLPAVLQHFRYFADWLKRRATFQTEIQLRQLTCARLNPSWVSTILLKLAPPSTLSDRKICAQRLTFKLRPHPCDCHHKWPVIKQHTMLQYFKISVFPSLRFGMCFYSCLLFHTLSVPELAGGASPSSLAVWQTELRLVNLGSMNLAWI